MSIEGRDEQTHLAGHLGDTAIGEHGLQASTESATEHAPSTAISAPEYSFASIPTFGRKIDSPHLGRARYGRSFYRSAQWCWDNSAVLTLGEDHIARVYQTSDVRTPHPSESAASISVPLPAPAVSSAWYPSASISSPATFCFSLGVRDAPVRLVDGYTGQTRATYAIVDHRERYIAPASMAYDTTATKLFCGHQNAIDILDLAVPGHDTGERVKTSRSRGERGGQKGIISAIAFAKDSSGLYAAGTYGASGGEPGSSGGSVSLYDEDTSGAVGHLGGVCGGGVTQIAFHSLSPSHLFVASRRSSLIQAYDIRNAAEPFHHFEREYVNDHAQSASYPSNQRLTFDVDPWGRYLAAGNTAGNVTIWSIGGTDWAAPYWQGSIGDDAVGSVQFSSTTPELLAAIGSREGPSSLAQSGPSPSSDSEDSASSDDNADGEELHAVSGIQSVGHGYLQLLDFSGSRTQALASQA